MLQVTILWTEMEENSTRTEVYRTQMKDYN